MTMDSVYTIPVIAQDLRQEENIIQIADTLDHLNRVVNDIFKRINCRIEENINRTQSIARRISVCSGKVDKLTGTNKATKVFSSSKYPGMECRKNYESLFEHGGCIIDMDRTEREIKSKPLIAIDKDHQEKLEFYHVKISQPDARRALLDSRPPKGLGPLPLNAPSIGCLLLYGTGETVYGATERTPGQSRGQVPLVQTVADTALDAAPFSLSNREKAGKAAEPYMYSPGLGEVPEMDVPQDLPHLPGVAGDLQFLSEAERVIAPSAVIASRPPEIFVETDQPQKQDIQQVTPVSNTESIKAAIPKQPEAIAKKVEEIVTEKKKEEVKEVVSGPPPPPPMPLPPAPLPPPMENLTEPDSAKKGAQAASASKKVPAAPSGTVDRDNLMEAIRNAGGLKKAKLRNTNAEETKKPVNSAGSGGDLMADLHAKLSMRRKGISGNRSIMEAMSAMIDRPTLSNDNVSNSSASSSAEDDWE